MKVRKLRVLTLNAEEEMLIQTDYYRLSLGLVTITAKIARRMSTKGRCICLLNINNFIFYVFNIY